MNWETTTAQFRPKRVGSQYMLCKSRPKNNGAFDSYVSPHDGFEVFIDVNLLKQISQESEYAAPYETIGLLAGRVWRDEKGPYTLVLAASSATREQVEATASHVRISGYEMAELREKLEMANPALEIIGWYHSHPRFTPYYSSEDKTEQSTWSDPHHIGIVVSGLPGEESYGVYRGPNSSRLVQRTGQLVAQETNNNVFQPVGGKKSQPTPKAITPTVQKTKKIGHSQPTNELPNPPLRNKPLLGTRLGGGGRFSLKKTLLIVAVALALVAGMLWVSHRFGAVEEELKKLHESQSRKVENANPPVNSTPAAPPASPDPSSPQKDPDSSQQTSASRQSRAGRAGSGRANSQPKNKPAKKADKPKAEIKPNKEQNAPKTNAAPGAGSSKDRASNKDGKI